MPRRFIVRPLAEADLENAARWYDEERPGLAGRFLNDVDQTLERICERPLQFPAVAGDVRRALLHTSRTPFTSVCRMKPWLCSLFCTCGGIPRSGDPECDREHDRFDYWTATLSNLQLMLLTIRTTHRPATDLGFLLHKHPDHVHTREFPFGNATVFYPEATEDACTAAVLLDVDPVGMVRGRGGKGGAEDQYVNDRPYVASSLLSVVLSRWFNAALGGRCERKPDLAATELPLEARLAAVPCRGGEAFLRALFEPLGYTVEATRHELDQSMPALGPSKLFTVTLHSTRRLSDLLTHLYVLIPVLDDQKHYWVGDDEVEKLLRHGEGWLDGHPSRDTIVSRYLAHQRGLVRDAIARLTAEEQPEEEAVAAQKDEQEASIERTISLNERRLDAVLEVLKASGAARVLDLGCGEGKLLRRLLADHRFAEIVGMDVSGRALDMAESRLKLDRLSPRQRERIRLMHGSLMYRDSRLNGFDAVSVVEVIEHLDQPRLRAFERVLFESARPVTIALTTPNAEYNVKWSSLPAGQFRHQDHRFEWTRSQFQLWGNEVASRFGYSVTYRPVGDEDSQVGPPTQMAVFVQALAAGAKHDSREDQG